MSDLKYYNLLFNISKKLDELHEIERLTFMCRGKISSEHGTISNALELFLELEEQGHLEIDCLDVLRDMLNELREWELLSKVLEFESSREEVKKLEGRMKVIKGKSARIISRSAKWAGGNLLGAAKLLCNFRTIGGGIVVVGAALILRKCVSLQEFMNAFSVAVLPAATTLHAISEGSLCFTVQAENLSALQVLWQQYQDGTLQKNLQDFLITEEIKLLANGQEVMVNVNIDEQEYKEACSDLMIAEARAEHGVETDRASTKVDRASSEVDGVSIEVDRASSEVDRASSKVDRASSEVDGASIEVDRASSEVDRASSEVDRASSEVDGASIVDRASSEVDRASSEEESATSKVDIEVDGASIEVDRASSEVDRASSEVDGASIEVDRASSEVDRASSEVDGASIEADRASSEVDRASSEEESATSKVDIGVDHGLEMSQKDFETSLEDVELMAQEYEWVNPVPKDLEARKVNGLFTVDLTEYDPPSADEFPNFSTIPELHVLKFFSNYLEEIPDDFCKLEHLSALNMTCSPFKPQNGLLRLPLQFGYLLHLEELHLVGNHFESFPMPICELVNVKKLYMDNCNLSKIPKDIKNMTSLVIIDFSYNSLGAKDSLPAELFELPDVEDLYLIDCKLSELPHEIGGMKKLVGLRVGVNQLTGFPDELYCLENLKKLSAERNKISELSPKIGQLHSLKLLLLMENQLTTLPDEIRDLRSCVHINLFDNKLTCLPQSIVDMPVLESIILDGNNNLRQPPLDVCSRGLDSIQGYFQSFATAGLMPVHSKRLKIVLLGESEAGKSSLAYALVNARALVGPGNQPQSTVGVDFFTWRPTPEGVEFHIVDCAGQRRYQLTHPFFFCPEALHILVVDLFKYEPNDSCFRKTVSDWLDLVTSRILKPRIMIVPTHRDKFAQGDTGSVLVKCNDILERVQRFNQNQLERINFEISEKEKRRRHGVLPKGGTDPEWKKKNPPIISAVLHSSEQDAPIPEPDNTQSYIAMVPVSNAPGLTGIVALQDEIIRVSGDNNLFPSVGRDLHPDWIKLEEALREHRKTVRCLTYRDFEDFASEHISLSPQSIRSAVYYLDAIGELRYYNDILSLRYNVFIDLRWLAKLVKCLFRHDQRSTLLYDAKYGRFGVSEPYFNILKEHLLTRAVLSEDLLRCLWLEMELSDEMFLEMVELLQHLGLACLLPSSEDDLDPEKFKLLVPWFLSQYPPSSDCLPATVPEGEEEVNLLFMTNYLPPGLFDRLRVRCCSLGYDYHNWKDHVLLSVNDLKVLVKQHKYPAGSEPSSPAIYVTGRGPQEQLDDLWEVVLRAVQETEALLREWQRLSVQHLSLCPPCMKQRKSKPCIFPCNWLAAATSRHGHVEQIKRCNSGMVLKGEKFDVRLIRPPPDVVKRVLDLTSTIESENVSDRLVADIAPQMIRSWKLVAPHLNFTYDNVANFDAGNTEPVEKVIAMLTEWKHNFGEEATRSKLIKALEKARRKDLADKVRVYKEQE